MMEAMSTNSGEMGSVNTEQQAQMGHNQGDSTIHSVDDPAVEVDPNTHWMTPQMSSSGPGQCPAFSPPGPEFITFPFRPRYLHPTGQPGQRLWNPQTFWGPSPPFYPPMAMPTEWGVPDHVQGLQGTAESTQEEPDLKRRKMYEPSVTDENEWHLLPELRMHMKKFMRDLSGAEIKQLREDCPRPSEEFLKPRPLDKAMLDLIPKTLTEKAKEQDGMFKSVFIAAADVMGPLGQAWTTIHKGCEAAATGAEPDCNMEVVLTQLEQSAVLMAHLLFMIEQKRRLASLKMFLKDYKLAPVLLREAEKENETWQKEKDELFGSSFFSESLKSKAKENKSLLEVKKSLGNWNWGPKPAPRPRNPAGQPFRAAPPGSKQAQWGEYGKFGRPYPYHQRQQTQVAQQRGQAAAGKAEPKTTRPGGGKPKGPPKSSA